jgi:hypothetical protein
MTHKLPAVSKTLTPFVGKDDWLKCLLAKPLGKFEVHQRFLSF